MMTDIEVLVSQNLYIIYALNAYKQVFFIMKGQFLKTSAYQKKHLEKKEEVLVAKKNPAISQITLT